MTNTAKALQTQLKEAVSELVSSFEKETGSAVWSIHIMYEGQGEKRGYVAVNVWLRENAKAEAK